MRFMQSSLHLAVIAVDLPLFFIFSGGFSSELLKFFIALVNKELETFIRDLVTY